MNGLPYYKAYPRDFIEGTVGMTLEQKGAYRLVLDLIYMQGGRLPDDPKYISGLLGCSVRKWNSLRDWLISEGKIYAREGIISNFRADKELITLRSLRDKMSENRSRPNKIKGLQSQRSHHTEPDTDTLTNVSGGKPPDLARILFDTAVRLLTSAGHAERSARALIGKWRAQRPDAEILSAVESARLAGSPDPAAYITAALQRRSKEDQRNAEVMKAWT